MKIAAVETATVDMGLRTPYSVAYSEVESVENVFVQLRTDSSRLVGLGCGAPDPHVTGETVESVTAAISEVGADQILGCDPQDLVWLVGRLEQSLDGSPTALATLDMALHDLWAKLVDRPLYELFGGRQQPVSTFVTIGITGVRETLERGRHYVERGFHRLKVKGGLDPQLDIERLTALETELDGDILIALDANQGYSVNDARRVLEAMGDRPIAFLEQPTHRARLEHLGELSREFEVPIVADEALTTAEQALSLACEDHADVWNLKLMKCGGIASVRRFDSLAACAGTPTMLGCMDESRLGAAAALQIVLSSANVQFVDLDGFLELVEDPAEGGFELEHGQLIVNGEPGLGVEVNLW